MASKRRRYPGGRDVYVRLNEEEAGWLDTLKTVHRLPKTVVVRAGIRWIARKLGVIASKPE